jgi:hypothetical protein
MTVNVRQVWLVTMALCLMASVFTEAQKKPSKPPSSLPGTAVFRCSFTQSCTSDDSILGDGTSYQGIGAAETGEGAHLSSVQEMWIGIGSGLHSVELHFTQPVGAAPCSSSATAPCRLSSTTVVAVDGEFQSNVLDANGQPSPNGLLDVAPGTKTRTRLKISFSDPWGRSLLWGLNFNTIDYAGATDVNVARTDQCTWVFEPGPNDRGGLSAYGSLNRGKAVRTDEGLYIMPFTITFSVPSMCP